MSCFIAEIAIIAIELAIKMNEDRVLSLEDCVNMLNNIGNVGMLIPSIQMLPTSTTNTDTIMTDESLLANR